MIRNTLRMIWNCSLGNFWDTSWKSKTLIVMLTMYFILSVPTVPLGSWLGYHLIGYFQNRNRIKAPTITITPDMYRSFNLAATVNPRFTEKINFIRDSLLNEDNDFAEFRPEGLDPISIHPYYNFDSRAGIVVVDFFLSCGCDEGSGKMRLFEIVIYTDSLDYQIVYHDDVLWSVYLNPWAYILEMKKALGQVPET